jgi:hypothetical protein
MKDLCRAKALPVNDQVKDVLPGERNNAGHCR